MAIYNPFPPHITAEKNQETSDRRFRPSRTIAICFDGTGDKFDADNSNVVKLFEALKKGDPNQVLYYQAGIGTYSGRSSLKSGLSAAADMAVGSGLGIHVRGGYRFLMENYLEGDKICLFGFSRGAYTARALAGMLHKVGLLPAGNYEQVSFAYQIYKDESEQSAIMATQFKKTFALDVIIHFVGVWDTVASVGFIPRELPFSRTINTSVRHFRHALALDEHRAKFKANHWVQSLNHPTTLAINKPPAGPLPLPTAMAALAAASSTSSTPIATPPSSLSYLRAEKYQASQSPTISEKAWVAEPESWVQEQKQVTQAQTTLARPVPPPTLPQYPAVPKSATLLPTSPSAGHFAAQKRRLSAIIPLITTPVRKTSASSGEKREKAKRQARAEVEEREKLFDKLDRELGNIRDFETDVQEVWFAGAHCDVGGGAVPNDTRHQLARVPLRWMIRQSFLACTGLVFCSDALLCVGLDVETLYPIALDRRPPPILTPRPSVLDACASGTLPPAGHGWATQNAIDGTKGIEEGLGETTEDYFDALANINDMLTLKKTWWVLEYWPVKRRTQDEDGTWIKKLGCNKGRYRAIRDERPKLHYTVLLRQSEKGYQIKNEVDYDARWEIVL